MKKKEEIIIEQEQFYSWTLAGDDKPYFISAMARIYQEINKCGFSAKMGLSTLELEIFNDVVEQLGGINQNQ
jgi:hypothetical protein